MNRQILHLAIPSIVSNITVPLLGLVDVAITGHMGDARYMAAIAIGSMMFNIIYWLFSFLRFGTGGMTAQAYGASPDPSQGGELNCNECSHILVRALVTCISLALALVVLQRPIFWLLTWIIEPDATLMPIVDTYYKICIWGAFPSLGFFALSGWFVGMQNTKLPMVISISQNIVNIFLSLLFVYYLHMKIEGVALGTMLAQWSGVLLGLSLLWRYYGSLWAGIMLKSAIKLREMKRFFSVNSTLFFRTVFLVAVNLFFIQAGAKGGSEILSVNSVMMQMFVLFSYVMDGFAFAAEALCGRYYGARDTRNFSLALRGIWKWSALLTILYTIAYAFGGEAFLAILTDDIGIRLIARDYLPWAILIPVCGIAAFVWDGVFVGITETKGMLAATFAGAVTFFALYFTLYPYFRNHALWIAFNSYLMMRGLTQFVIWNRKKKVLMDINV